MPTYCRRMFSSRSNGSTSLGGEALEYSGAELHDRRASPQWDPVPINARGRGLVSKMSISPLEADTSLLWAYWIHDSRVA